MESETSDFNEINEAIGSLVIDEQQQGYQPRTLNEHNQQRFAYLPTFPPLTTDSKQWLLLANIPETCLNTYELRRRQHVPSHSPALMFTDQYNDSTRFSLTEHAVNELATRLKVDTYIITFNADRLRRLCHYMLLLHNEFGRTMLSLKEVAIVERTLDSTEMALALEFFLQMDVDLFYMKTCSFRGAQPRSDMEGLFCSANEPEANYQWTPCLDLECTCCFPLNHQKKSQPWSVVDFTSSSKHTFVNGYTTYLNAPMSCKTTNVIYALTCPCGQYDYIDSTSGSIEDAISRHREYSNRLIHEKLTGYTCSTSTFNENDSWMINATSMRLYQHTIQCPYALRSFLDCNPDYWCLIPLTDDEANAENIAFSIDTPDRDSHLTDQTETTTMSQQLDITTWLNNVSTCALNYTFSNRQVQQQVSMFERLLTCPTNERMYSLIDLYKVAVIAVLPDESSKLLRYILETLFSVHGECKLNMISPIGMIAARRFGPSYLGDWVIDLRELVSKQNSMESS